MHARSLLLLLLGIAIGCTAVDAPAGQCRYDSDCSEGQVCAGTYCRAGCRTDRDCPTGQRCGESDRLNVSTCIPMVIDAQCSRASDCPAGLVCLDGACRPQCQRDYDCQVINPFFSCVSGTCALSCAAGLGDCDGDPRNGCETSLTASTSHCGTCTTTCAGAANADGVCAASACATRCREGFADCDGNAANGCEVTLATDAAHCGTCATTCPGGANATGVCAASTCGRQCNAGFADCDGNAANGCEVTLATDATHCGTCATSCPSAANADGVCMASMCGRQCRAGFADCDGNAANGCEVTLATDAAHCATCANACSFPNAESVCAEGACGLGTCAAGFGNCDGDAANGCETPTNTGTNCGACGTTCGAGTVCSAGTCTSICATGTTYCGEACVNTATSTTNCGTCGRVCTAPANSVATCAASLCGFTCNAGYTRLGEGCAPIAAGRLVGPPSLSTLNGNTNVTFEVSLAPGTDGAAIELCRDRACTMSIERFGATGNRIAHALALPGGLYFWRAYGRIGTNTGLTPSTQTWEVVVPARNRAADGAWGTLPDFNGDGYGDLAIGEPGGDRALIYHGAATGIPAEPTRTIDDDTITGGFGNYVTAGDFNGDGFADLAAASDSSTFYVYAGSATGLAATRTTRTGTAGYGGVIQAVSDLNRDGYADLAVAFSCFGLCRSGVDVYLGSATGLGTTPAATITAPDDFTSFRQIAAVGRLTTDSPYESLVLLGIGKGSFDVFVYRGTATGIDTTPVQTFEPPYNTYNIAAAHDINGDGLGDVVMSTPGYKSASTLRVYLGASAGLPTTPSLTLSDDAPLGGPVAGLGDVNGDGYGDVITGNGYDTVQVYFGGASPVLTAGPIITPPEPPSGARYPNFGDRFPYVGDFNRDTLADIVVAAPPDYDGDCDNDYFVYPGRVATTGTFTPARVLTVTDLGCFAPAAR